MLARFAKARGARQGEQAEHRWFESIRCHLARKLVDVLRISVGTVWGNYSVKVRSKEPCLNFDFA